MGLNKLFFLCAHLSTYWQICISCSSLIQIFKLKCFYLLYLILPTMKKSIFFILLLTIATYSIAQDKTIVAAGQMPAIAKDNHQYIHLVYGSGDSILYTSSNNKGASFTNPQLVGILPGLVDYATRGPQITTTGNGVAIIAVNK